MAVYVCGGDLDAFRELCARIVRAILNNFDHPLLLVPHVMNSDKKRDDHYFMKGIADAVGRDRVTLLPPGSSAAQTKWHIARCHVFAAARTHATIAAFSSEVPTLSFGYSFKAEGLNQDIYGHQDHCVRAKDFSEQNIVDALGRLLKERELVRVAMRPAVARMKERAFESGAVLKKLCEGRLSV